MSLTKPYLASGTALGGQVVEGELGRGGMGVVYRARDARLGRSVALKVLSPNLAADQQFRMRFERESRLAASLEHPNIVPVYGAGEEAGLLYLSMRLIAGEDLGRRLRAAGRLAPAHAVHVLGQIAAALDAAHARMLVHRDVKPANILLDGPAGLEHAYLTDFGVTKTLSSDTSGLTQTGAFIGTVDYVAPEQLRGDPIDGRADVYALACVLYQCITGQVPYPRETDMAKIFAHGSSPPPRPTDVVPDLAAALDGVVAQGMAKDRDERYPTASRLIAAAAAAGAGATRPMTVAPAFAAPPAAPTAVSEGPAAAPATAAQPPAAPPTRTAPLPSRAVAAPPPRARSGPAPALVAAVTAALVLGVVALVLALRGSPEPAGERPASSAVETATPSPTPPAEPSASPSPSPEPTATEAPGLEFRQTASETGGYAVDLPAWAAPTESTGNQKLWRLRTERADGAFVLVAYTPGEPARPENDCAAAPAIGGLETERCSPDDFLDDCRAELTCVTYLLNDRDASRGWAIVAATPEAAEAEEIAERVATSLEAR